MKESGCETPKKNPGNVPRLIHESLAPNPLSRFFLHQLISRDILKKQVCTPSHPSLSVTKQNKPTLLSYRTPSPDTLSISTLPLIATHPIDCCNHHSRTSKPITTASFRKSASTQSARHRRCHTPKPTFIQNRESRGSTPFARQRFVSLRRVLPNNASSSFARWAKPRVRVVGASNRYLFTVSFGQVARTFPPLKKHKTQKKENFRFAHASNLYFTFMYMQIILELLLCLNLLGVTTVRALLMSLRDSTSVPSSLLLLLLLAVLLVCSRPPAPVRQSSPLQVR